jgi:hypothetical protein
VGKWDGRRLPAELPTQAEEDHARAPRLSATERIRAQIDELFASKQDLGQVLEKDEFDAWTTRDLGG